MPYTLAELSDRLEINELYSRYVHATDEHDFDGLDRIFLPTTTFDYNFPDKSLLSYHDARATPMFSGELFPWSFHACTNLVIDFEDGGRTAKVRSKTLCPMGRQTKDGKNVMLQLHGVYHDRVETSGDGWRITQRIWKESWISGPFGKVDGIPAALELGERQS